jgi:large subunit ribosomal protein L10
MKRRSKKDIVEVLKDKLLRSNVILFFTFRGLSAGEMSELRRCVNKYNAEVKVSKNKLIKLCLPHKIPEDKEKKFLSGQTMLILNYDEDFPVKMCKEISAFMKEHPSLAMKGGLVYGRIVEDFSYLLSIPPKSVAIAQLLTLLNTVKFRLVFSLKYILMRLVYDLEVIEKRQKGHNIDG